MVVGAGLLGGHAAIYPGASVAYDPATDPSEKLALDPQTFPDVVGMVVAGSPRSVPGITPSATAEEWYRALHTKSPAFDLQIQALIAREQQKLPLRTRLWDWAKLVATRTSPAAAFIGGYLIGGEIYAFFGGEEFDPGTGIYGTDTWEPVAPGDPVLQSNYGGTVYAPDFGMVGWSSQAGPGRETDTHTCERRLAGGGTPLYTPNWIPATFCGISQYREYVLFNSFEVFRCDDVRPCPGIDPQAYNGVDQPTLPSRQELEDATWDELWGDEYPVSNRMVNHLVDPENWPDPRITRKEENHACDRFPGPIYSNPGGNSGPGEFVRIGGEWSVTHRPPGHEGKDVYLHWGTTHWGPGKNPNMPESDKFLDDWKGWGYRHIRAKHGWGPDDIVETGIALQLATPHAK